jgi:hypothetical protein
MIHWSYYIPIGIAAFAVCMFAVIAWKVRELKHSSDEPETGHEAFDRILSEQDLEEMSVVLPEKDLNNDS